MIWYDIFIMKYWENKDVLDKIYRGNVWVGRGVGIMRKYLKKKYGRKVIKGMSGVMKLVGWWVDKGLWRWWLDGEGGLI